MLDEMAKRERKSKSEVIMRCIEYYYNSKWPGNPQPPLFPAEPSMGEPLARLKEARLRKAITFLRFEAQLSYGQIAKVVDMSYGFVYKHCKGLDHYETFNGRKRTSKMSQARAFRKNLKHYRERFEAWMRGKYNSVEEAFRWE
jgi:hypothetical protein